VNVIGARERAAGQKDQPYDVLLCSGELFDWCSSVNVIVRLVQEAKARRRRYGCVGVM
jgi:hypothetical protein